MKRLSKTIILILILALNSSTMAFANTIEDKSLEKEIANHMKNFDTNFYFTYNEKSALDILQDAAREDDYIERSISLYKTWKYKNIFKVQLEYRTTKEQEKLIDSELTRVINNIINPTMTTIEKVNAINEYIVKIYKYDYSLESDNVYSAMKTGTTICQGYAMTAYKMFNMLGIECRIVNGYKDNGSHAWNLVKIDNNWYHLDITNNDTIVRNKYLLKSDEFMKENKFVWDENKYESAVSDYYNYPTEFVDYNNDKESYVEKYYNSSLFIK